MQASITFVTGFLDLTEIDGERRRADTNVKQREDYFHQAIRLFRAFSIERKRFPALSGASMIVHVSENDAALLQQQLGDLSDGISYQPLQFSELPLFSDRQFYEMSAASHRRFPIAHTDPNGKDTAAYKLLVHSKAHLLQRVCRTTKDEDVVCWVDFGLAYTRPNDDDSTLQMYWREMATSLQLLRPNCFRICGINYQAKFTQDRVSRPAYYSTLRWVAAAGLIGGSRTAITHLTNKWLAELDYCVRQCSLLPTEEQVLGWLLGTDSEIFEQCEMYFGDHVSVISNAMYPRHSRQLIERGLFEAVARKDSLQAHRRHQFLSKTLPDGLA